MSPDVHQLWHVKCLNFVRPSDLDRRIVKFELVSSESGALNLNFRRPFVVD